MSAPAKEPQSLGSTSGKLGYIRTCVRCGVPCRILMKPKIETALVYMMGVVALVALIAWCAALTIAPFALIKLCMAILAA